MSEDVMGRVAIEDVRLAGFVSLHSPSEYKGDGNFKYGAHFILAKGHPALASVVSAMRTVAMDKWKDKAGAMLTSLKAQDKLALHDGDAKADREGYAGNVFVSASARPSDPPTIWDRANQPLLESSGKPYAGCQVDVVLDLWAQDNDYGKRVNATIVLVRFRGDGDRLGGGVATPVAPDVFAPLEDAGDSPVNMFGDPIVEKTADEIDDGLPF